LLAEVSHIESSSQGRPKTEAELQVLVDCQLELTSVNEELEKHRATLPPHLQHMIDEAPRNELLLSDDDDDDDDTPAARRHARHARLNVKFSFFCVYFDGFLRYFFVLVAKIFVAQASWTSFALSSTIKWSYFN